MLIHRHCICVLLFQYNSQFLCSYLLLSLRMFHTSMTLYFRISTMSFHCVLCVCVPLTEHVLIFKCLSIPPGSRNSCLLELRPACAANQREQSH